MRSEISGIIVSKASIDAKKQLGSIKTSQKIHYRSLYKGYYPRCQLGKSGTHLEIEKGISESQFDNPVNTDQLH